MAQSALEPQRVLTPVVGALVFLCCLCLSSPTRPQVSFTFLSGTVVALEFVGDGIVVAADSLELGPTGSTSYKACKIVPLGDQMFFAATGTQGWLEINNSKTTGVNFAHMAFEQSQSMPSTTLRNQKIAERYGELMAQGLQQTGADRSPKFVADTRSQDGFVAMGIFGSNTIDGKLPVYLETIHYSVPPHTENGKGESQPRFWSDGRFQEEQEDHVLSFGYNDGVKEFMDRKTSRAVAANEKADDAVKEMVDRIEKNNLPFNRDMNAITVEFAIKAAEEWGGSRHIGGDVDSLELPRAGKVRWIHVKKECETKSGNARK